MRKILNNKRKQAGINKHIFSKHKDLKNDAKNMKWHKMNTTAIQKTRS